MKIKNLNTAVKCALLLLAFVASKQAIACGGFCDNVPFTAVADEQVARLKVVAMSVSYSCLD